MNLNEFGMLLSLVALVLIGIAVALHDWVERRERERKSQR